MKKIGYFLKSFLPFLLFLLLQFGVTYGMMAAYGIYHFAVVRDGSTVLEFLNSLASDSDFTQAASVVFSLVIILIFGTWYRRAFVRPLRGKKRKYWSGISLQILVSMIFFAFGLQYLSRLVTELVTTVRPEWLTAYEELLDSAGYSSMTLLLLVYSIILGPVGEELTFRGLTYRLARRAMPFWGANILQALLFGIMHGNMYQGIFAFAVGLFLGWVCRTGHSIKYSILLHILFNILGTLFAAFFTLTEELSQAASYAAGIALLVFAMLIFRWEHKRKNQER